MSIASRIQAIEQHLTDDYSVLTLAGADLTNVNKNILNLKTTWQERLLYFINNGTEVVWNNWDKVTGEGTTLTLNNTEEAPMKIDLKGNTSQATTTGKNLLKNTNVNSGDSNFWSSYSTYDKETGTLTRSTTLTTESFIPHKINLKSNTKYTISCLAKSNGYVRNLDIFAYNSTTTKMYSKSNISLTTNFQKYSFTFTTDSTDFTNSTIRFDNNGSTQSGTEAILTIKDVMLVEGEDTEFEPYTNGASPNPDYPQDIHVVSGDNSINVVGKNLFTLKNISNATTLGVEKTINNSILTLNGTTTGPGQIIGRKTTKITLLAGTYSVLVQKKSGTVTPNGYQTAFYFRKPNGTEITSFLLNNYWGNYSFKTTFVLSEATELYVELYCNGTGYVLDNLTLQFQIEKGSSASGFEQYVSNTYPVNLPIENLFELPTTQTINGITFTNNGNGTFNLSGTASAITDFAISKELSTIANGKITISSKSTGYSLMFAFYNGNTWLSTPINKVPTELIETGNINIPSNATKYSLVIRVSSGSTINLINETAQVEKGSKANSFTPYGTTPIELCKIGTYQDNIVKDNGKWYVKKEVGKFYSNSTTGWNYDNNHRYYRLIDNIVVPPNNDTLGQGFCNVRLVTANQTLITSTTPGLAIHPISRLYISEVVYNNIPTTPIVLYYAYITPTITEITDSTLLSQLEALKKAISYDEQTNISQENNDMPFILDITALSK